MSFLPVVIGFLNSFSLEVLHCAFPRCQLSFLLHAGEAELERLPRVFPNRTIDKMQSVFIKI